MTGGQALVRSLEAHGVTTVFGIPGTHNLAVYDALLDSPIRHVSARHEQGAAFMADGYARAGGEVGVCLSTTEPAALNTLTPLGTAFSDSSRVLCVASQIQADFLGRGKGLLHECSVQSGGFRAVTKWWQQATTVEAIPWLVRSAPWDSDCPQPSGPSWPSRDDRWCCCRGMEGYSSTARSWPRRSSVDCPW